MSEIKVPQIVAIGELLWDLLPGGARLGGAPANFAVFCARLGNRSVLVSSLGNDNYGNDARRSELLWDLLPGGARLGGAPANFAVFCARLGNRSVLVSSLGNDNYGNDAR